jgi:hypothetical protein
VRQKAAAIVPVLAVLALLAAVAVQAAIPAPRQVLGFEMGEDRKLADWNQVIGYFQKAAAGDPERVKYAELGKTTDGRPFALVTISSAGNMARLEHYRGLQARLADPRGLSEEEANRLIREGKAVVLITCTVHSTEVASTLAAIEYVYRLLTEDTPRHRLILENTIFLLVPSLNPDGLDMVADWYRKSLGARWEGSPPPFLYHRYVGHDDNRDWYMFTQAETRLMVGQVHNVWHPHVVYDMHQMGLYAARMFTPPWLDPVDPNIDPLLVSEVNMLGTAMAADLATAGKKGVVVNAMYDYWGPARHYQSYHGGLRILTEAASARLATPVDIRFEQLDTGALGYSAQQATWNHPDPWPGGAWRLRDIVDYELIAMEACLFYTAQNREMFLRNFYRIGKNALEPWPGKPAAFLVPPDQKDPATAAKMLNVLRFGMVEVQQSKKPFTADGAEYPAGTYIISLDQPYSPWAKTMLERQKYPDLRQYPGGPPKRPYDVTAHTLPLLMGVKAVEVRNKLEAEAELVRSDLVPPPGAITGASAAAFLLQPTSTSAFQAVNRLLKKQVPVSRDSRGNFVVRAPAAAIKPLADEFGLQFRALERGARRARPLRPPRIGVYQSYVPSMDEGWTRFVLEQFEFPYRTLYDKDIRAGKLNESCDVILIADMSRRVIVEGYPSAGQRGRDTGPLPAEPRPGERERGELPFFTGPMPEEYAGGLGEAGVRALHEFVQQGGAVVLLNRACAFGSELGVSIKNVLSGVATREFYAPGSLLRIQVDTRHPLGWGMDAEAAAWFEQGPAFEIPASAADTIKPVATFPETNPLLSGWLLGDNLLHKRPVVVDAQVGRGHVVLFGIRPQYRAQSHGTYTLLFNSLFYF